MRSYMKPEMKVERFALNEAVATEAGCQHYDASDPSATTVYCKIGSQSETVFGSSCSMTANSHAIVVDYNGGTQDYFVWFTYKGDTSGSKPSASATKFLAALVRAAGFTDDSGWHYAEVNASGTDAFDTNHIS